MTTPTLRSYPKGRMPNPLPPKQRALLRVSQATREQHDQWGEGAHLRGVLRVDLETARAAAAADRIQLAARFLSAARASYAVGRYRDAVSRGYYAAYHALRAAAFSDTGGDDYQQHSDLPKQLPEGLPDVALTKNALTAARLARNKADYEPYPKSEAAWKADADTTIAFGKSALADARRYLSND